MLSIKCQSADWVIGLRKPSVIILLILHTMVNCNQFINQTIARSEYIKISVSGQKKISVLGRLVSLNLQQFRIGKDFEFPY